MNALVIKQSRPWSSALSDQVGRVGSVLCKIAFLFYCNVQLCHDIATPFHFPKQVHFSVALIISCKTTLFFDIANSGRIFAEFQTHIIYYTK